MNTRAAFAMAALLASGCDFSPPEVDGPGDGAEERTDWFDPDFRARRAITVDNTGRDALIGFPLAVHFDGSDAARFGPSGEQIRFRGVDNTVDLPFEIERVGSSALAWVRLDVAANATTEFTMYYDNANAAPASDGRATFEGFDAVYHFADTFAAGQPSPDPVESSLAGPDLDHVIALDSGSPEDIEADGVLGSALRLERSQSEFLDTSNAEAALIAESGEVTTYQAWFKTPTMTAERIILDNYDASCRGVAIFIGGAGPDDGKLVCDFCTGASETRAISDVIVDDDQWHHVAVVVDRVTGTLQLHIDGTLQDTRQGSDITNSATSTGATRVGNGTFLTRPYEGLLDEIRVSGPVPSHWFDAVFANRKGAPMVSVDAEETF